MGYDGRTVQCTLTKLDLLSMTMTRILTVPRLSSNYIYPGVFINADTFLVAAYTRDIYTTAGQGYTITPSFYNSALLMSSNQAETCQTLGDPVSTLVTR